MTRLAERYGWRGLWLMVMGVTWAVFGVGVFLAPAALASVDQAAELATERARWTTQVWDRTSPINGVPAAHFLARDDVSDSPCYLLLCDGEVVYFQPHQPGVAGHKAITDPQAAAKTHADKVAGERADSQVLAEVEARLKMT